MKTLFIALTLIFTTSCSSPSKLPLPATIFDTKGNEIATKSLRGKTVAMYFSAHWCVPCRHFTPKLIDFYEKNKNFEVVFMSLDRSEKMKNEYMHEEGMKWLTAPSQGTKEINQIMETYKVEGIPALLVFNSNGELITANGREDITYSPETAMKKWKN